jgi:uncharacterized protein (DUF169 family)
VGRKYGKTMTFNETKYDLEQFKQMLLDNPEFHAEIKAAILNKIKQADVQQEVVEDQI